MSLAGAGALVTSIFGAGNSQNGNNKSTSSGEGLTKNNSTTINNGRSVQNTVNSGKSTSDTGTTTSSKAGTTQTAKSGGTQTTIGTADAGALATAKGLTATSLADSTDNAKTQALVDNTFKQAAISFAPTLSQGTAGAGLYNSSTTDLLSGYAKGQATAQAAGEVLNYQQGEQNIAATTNENVLNATKGSTGTTSNASVGQSNTGTTSTQNADTTGTSSSDSNTGSIDKSSTQLSDIINSLTRGGAASTNSTAGDSGGVFSSLSVVCGEMKKIGKMDNKLWAIVTNHFLYHTSTLQKKAYWSWAEPFVGYMRKKPDSWIVKLGCWLTHERAVYIAWKFRGEHGLSYWEYSWKGPFSYWMIAGISTAVGTFTVLPSHIWEKLNSKKWKEFDDFDRSIP